MTVTTGFNIHISTCKSASLCKNKREFPLLVYIKTNFQHLQKKNQIYYVHPVYWYFRKPIILYNGVLTCLNSLSIQTDVLAIQRFFFTLLIFVYPNLKWRTPKNSDYNSTIWSRLQKVFTTVNGNTTYIAKFQETRWMSLVKMMMAYLVSKRDVLKLRACCIISNAMQY
jgi:hypothetical protein